MDYRPVLGINPIRNAYPSAYHCPAIALVAAISVIVGLIRYRNTPSAPKIALFCGFGPILVLP